MKNIKIVIDSDAAAKVSQDVAIEEVKNWIAYRDGIEPTALNIEVVDSRDGLGTDLEGSTEVLVNSMMQGLLSIDEDYNIKQTLKFPIKDTEGNVVKSELNFTSRLTAAQTVQATKGMAAGSSPFQMFVGYCSVLTNEISGIIGKVDTRDFKISQAIASFFI